MIIIARKFGWDCKPRRYQTNESTSMTKSFVKETQTENAIKAA